MRRLDLLSSILVLLFGASSIALAVPITLFNTGVDNSGSLLPAGSVDPHYTILETATSGIVIRDSIPGSWIPNGPNSKWIWEDINGKPTSVIRSFRTTFDLTGFDLSTVSISGDWSTDNSGLDILINGNSTGITSPGFTSFTSFLVNSDFVAGMNTLDFEVFDFGGIAGFRAELSGQGDLQAPVIPEPSTYLLFGIGILAIVGMGYRQRK